MLDRIRAWWNSAEATKKSEVPSRRVCVFVDASPESRHAFLWATTNLLKKEARRLDAEHADWMQTGRFLRHEPAHSLSVLF